MAIGDSFAAYIGTAQTDRQPSAGVSEELSSACVSGTTDKLVIYNGSVDRAILNPNVQTSEQVSAAARPSLSAPYNMSIRINNTVYMRKEGTTDRYGISGVQIDA